MTISDRASLEKSRKCLEINSRTPNSFHAFVVTGTLRQADAAQQVLEALVGSGLGAGGMRRDDYPPDTNWRGEQD
jgi:hypothetical protein